MSERLRAVEEALGSMPESVGMHLDPIRSGATVLPARSVRGLIELLNVRPTQLGLMLLKLAASFSRPTISHYRVGAVALGLPDESGWPTLYLGGNIELSGQALGVTVHAEQAATLNAWLHGERGLAGIAVSSPPCGYCRQFLYELHDAAQIPVIVDQNGEPGRELRLSDLLPDAFGPSDLGIKAEFMRTRADIRLVVRDLPRDPLVQHALRAAERSYAPYTGGYAGCVIATSDGRVFEGRYAENAAYNPSVSAIRCGIVTMVLGAVGLDPSIVERTVLVEAESETSQLHEAEQLVGSHFPNARLEYYRAASVS